MTTTKIVVNRRTYGLHLNEAEMRMFCALRGWRLTNHDKPITSSTAWFAIGHGTPFNWDEFRADPLLVRLCEEGMLSNEDLMVVELEDDYMERWEIRSDFVDTLSTGFRTAERVIRHMWDFDHDAEVDDWVLVEDEVYLTEGETE